MGWQDDAVVSAKPAWAADPVVTAAPVTQNGEYSDIGMGAPSKRKVGAGEAGARGVGSSIVGQGNVLGLAAAAPAMLVDAVGNFFRDKPSTAAQDFVFGNVTAPIHGLKKRLDIDPNTEQMDTGATLANIGGNLAGMVPGMVLGGAATAGPRLAAMAPVVQNLVKGAVAAQPSFAVPSTINRAQDLLDAGVDGTTVAKASASNLGMNTLMGALPVAKAGGVLTRAATGAGINTATGAAQRGAEAEILGDEYARVAQDPFGGKEMGLDAGIGAMMAALLGPRAAAVARPPVAPDVPPPRAEPLALPAPETTSTIRVDSQGQARPEYASEGAVTDIVADLTGQRQPAPAPKLPDNSRVIEGEFRREPTMPLPDPKAEAPNAPIRVDEQGQARRETLDEQAARVEQQARADEVARYQKGELGNTSPDALDPRKPGYVPRPEGVQDARPDNPANDGAGNGERRPATYDAEPRAGEDAAARISEPARPDAAPDGATGPGAVPPRAAASGPDAVPANPDGGGARVDPKAEKREASRFVNDLIESKSKSGRGGITPWVLKNVFPTKFAEVKKANPMLVNNKGHGEDGIVRWAKDKGWISQAEIDRLNTTGKRRPFDAVADMLRDAVFGKAPKRQDDASMEADYKARQEAAEDADIAAEATRLGVDIKGLPRDKAIDAVMKADAERMEVADREAANEAAAAAHEEALNGRTIDDLLDEVGVSDKDIEDAKWKREGEAESRAAADVAGREEVNREAPADEVRQSRDGQDEKRPDARPGGEQVDGGSGQGSGERGQERPAAGEAGGKSARADEANYRLNALPFDAVFRGVKQMLGDGKQWKEYADWLHDVTASLANQLKKPGEALTALKGKMRTDSGENAAMAVIRWANEDLGRRARIIVEKTDSATARKVLDMMDFEMGRGEGTAKVFREAVQQRMGKSLNELATELQLVNGIAETMKKGGMGRKESYAKAWEEVIKRVENPSMARQGDIGKAAVKVEAWLKGQRDMQVAAGVDLGDQGARYFPVKYDADKVQADRVSFERDAAAAYMREGATAEEAKAQAKALADGLIRGESFSLVGVETGAAASATKERVFTKTESLNQMRKWRNLDGRDVLISYANSAARRASIAERFGDNFGGKKDQQGKTVTPSWKDLVAKITDEGGTDALPILRDLVEIGTGVNQPRGTGAQYADAMRNAMTMSALEKSVLPNLMETVTPLATTNGNVAAGLSMLRTNIHGALGGLGLLPKSERRAAAQSLLEGIGALSDIGSQQQAMARYSGHDSGKGGFSESVGKFFEGIGLNKLTDAQRISTADIGAVWFDSLAKSVTGNAGWKSLTKGADAKHLRDMGIPADKVQAFAEYVKGLKGKIPTTAELGKAGEMGALYGDAITRFMNSTVQHGDALTRPSWASTPWGSLVFQFSSYTYAFHKNVVRRAYNNAMDAGNLKNGLNTADRLSLATGMLPGFMLMGAVSYLTMELRDEVFNEMAGTKKNLSDQAKKERAVQNANLFGKYGRIFEQFGQQRYGAGAAGLFVPPAVAQGAKGVDALSQSVREGTDKNTGERKMAKWAYNTILEPAWQIALSAGPGIPFGAASVAARTLAPSAGEGAFVDAVAGPGKKRSEKPQKGVFE